MNSIPRRRLPPPTPQLVTRRPSDLQKNPKNARKHSPKQICQLASSILEFGHFGPIVIDDRNGIIAGHGRYEAAKQLGYAEIPCFVVSGLTEHQKIGLALADNKIALNAVWDQDLLKEQLLILADPVSPVDASVTGFDTVEIDNIIFPPTGLDTGAEDEVPPVQNRAITCLGDVWTLGEHQIICGDSRQVGTFEALMGSEKARMVFQDPPYNVRIDGHVSGLGRVRHREFAMASGEMSAEQFRTFLADTLKQAANFCQEGAIMYSCMDWRHVEEMQDAGRRAELELKNLIVWVKTNAGMGTFYRSAHELIFALKKGRAAHVNNFRLGQSGRYRTNVWEYPGVNTFRRGRTSELADHPTPKPVALIADAIRDVSNLGDIVLDSFGGSGSTLIAAERTRRRARLLEIDPLYVDVTIRRWEAFTGLQAVHRASLKNFEQISIEREH